MEGKRSLRVAVIILAFLFLAGCAWIPARKEAKVDLNVPVGKIEGNQLIGIRYPFKVSAPPGWQVATKYPEFMLKLGFDKEELEASQVFVFNPDTQSTLQIDFEPADRYSRWNQKNITQFTAAAAGSYKAEFEKTYGKKVPFEVGPTEAYSLKGVPYAAKRYATYTVKGVKHEDGWIYAFAEPYQIFIIYMILEKEGVDDRAAVKAILNSFEYIPKK